MAYEEEDAYMCECRSHTCMDKCSATLSCYKCTTALRNEDMTHDHSFCNAFMHFWHGGKSRVLPRACILLLI